jgi:molybdate transport system ATP-binding protein
MKPFIHLHIKLQRRDFLLDIKAEITDGITGIFGPSGHGKTSFLNAIAGLITPDSGQININGAAVFNSKKRINTKVKNRKIGYVFQDLRLFPHLTIEQNLKYGLRHKTNKSLITEVNETLKISTLLKKKPDACSGGEKQRVAIGRAILSGSEILLLDEPFSAIDVNLRQEIIPFLIAVNHKFKIPLVVVSHDLPDLLSLTENLVLLQSGRIRAHGKFQDLILKKANLKLMHETGFYNILHLFVFAYCKSKNLVLLKSDKSDLKIQVINQSIKQNVKINSDLKVLIKPENIALAKQPVSGISLRNQIPGKIKKIFNRNGLAFCVVDVGEKIIVEITEASQINMDLKVGTVVYCLFKSAALKIF